MQSRLVPDRFQTHWGVSQQGMASLTLSHVLIVVLCFLSNSYKCQVSELMVPKVARETQSRIWPVWHMGVRLGRMWPLQALHVHAKYCIQHHATCLRDLIHAFTGAVRDLAAPDPDALLAEVEKAAGRRFTSDYIAIRQKHSWQWPLVRERNVELSHPKVQKAVSKSWWLLPQAGLNMSWIRIAKLSMRVVWDWNTCQGVAQFGCKLWKTDRKRFRL